MTYSFIQEEDKIELERDVIKDKKQIKKMKRITDEELL